MLPPIWVFHMGAFLYGLRGYLNYYLFFTAEDLVLGLQERVAELEQLQDRKNQVKTRFRKWKKGSSLENNLQYKSLATFSHATTGFEPKVFVSG